MSAKAFVDSNVLVYAHDTSAGEKREQGVALVRNLWRSFEGGLSVQSTARVLYGNDKKTVAHAGSRKSTCRTLHALVCSRADSLGCNERH